MGNLIMVKDIFTLATQYQNTLQPRIKTAGKDKMNRKRMSGTLEKAKGDYAKHKKELDILEADDTKLKEKLEATRSGAAAARKKMLQLHKAMSNMDLANANDAVFYADDEDVGYVINGKEFHLDVDDVGDVKLTPMSAHRKSKKTKKADENCTDENCADDSHNHFGPGDKKVKTDDESDDGDDDEDDANNSGDGEFDDLYATLLE